MVVLAASFAASAAALLVVTAVRSDSSWLESAGAPAITAL